MKMIGIRHEDKYAPERRSPLVPADVRELTARYNLQVRVETSSKRIFTHEEFEAAGAMVTDDLAGCDIILGVKEMPVGYFRKGVVYVYFSHVIKGQAQNMSMLRDLVDAGATLIDYERILDEKGRRLIFFGRHAGIAGMINTLWTLGRRFKALGMSTPFEKVRQAASYGSLEEARSDIRAAGEELHARGLPDGAGPLVFAVTGDGNVAQGALEIMELLPVVKVPAARLSDADVRKQFDDSGRVYLANLVPADYMVHREGRAFDLDDYIAHPDNYESRFEHFLEPLDVLVNGIYWDERYPRLVTRQWLRERNEANGLRLRVIGDITCDPEGSVECTVKATGIEDPVFVYDPATGGHAMGFEGPGVAVMAVDILPSELPRESSEHFSRHLSPWIPTLASADFRVSFGQLQLPPELKSAVIVHNGRLTPDYAYLERHLGLR